MKKNESNNPFGGRDGLSSGLVRDFDGSVSEIYSAEGSLGAESAVGSVTTGRAGGKAWNLSRFTFPSCAMLGVLLATAVVFLWFPSGSAAWLNPLQEIDAPAHYYFIRKILDEGIGAATHLWPNDEYYPPLFHLLAAGLIRIAGFFGLNVSVYAAFNMVWLATSGLIWPVAMQLFASYFTIRRSSSRSWPSAHPFPCVIAIIVPLLAVASACHPFQMLASGPLIAFGLATTLLPFWLYCTLRLMDAVTYRVHVPKWVVWFLSTAGICVFAHPRIAFTWLLLMAPFALTRLPWKAIAALVVAALLGAGALLVYMMFSYKSDRYFDPSSWFHTFAPNRTVPEALRIYVTENISGAQGWFMAVVVVVALIVSVVAAACPRLFLPNRMSECSRLRADAIAVTLSFFLVGLVYVCSTALTGWFPNIVTAVWYRAETRPLTMIPFGVLPLIIFAAAVIFRGTSASSKRRPMSVRVLDDVTTAVDGGYADTVRVRGIVIRTTTIVVLASLAACCQFNNTVRAGLSDSVYANMTIDDVQPEEQLTATKEKILERMVKEVGTDSVVVSDPLNGSMYATAMYGADMLFPIYNPKSEKNGAIFGQTENAFASGNGDELLNTVCPLSENGDAYFLSMGEQAPSLQMFTFKEQYYTFHDQNLIDGYVADGTMTMVQDYSDLSKDSDGWALYQFSCH